MHIWARAAMHRRTGSSHANHHDSCHRREPLSPPAVSRFFQQLIFFRRQFTVRRSAREATLAPGRGFGPLLLFPLLVKVGAAALVLCWSSLGQPSPHARVTATGGAQNMQLLRHPSSHYPITFTPSSHPSQKIKSQNFTITLKMQQLKATALE